MSFINIHSPFPSCDLQHVGGKAFNLIQLANLGLKVPKGFVIPGFYFNKYCRQFIVDYLENLKKLTNEPDYRSEYDNKKMYDNIKKNLTTQFITELNENINLFNFEKFAVRSSATIEDGKESSFAGIFNSFININNKDVVEKIIQTWLSSFSRRTIAYCQIKKIDPSEILMAVILQEMVFADLSGVCFSTNIFSQKSSQVYIEIVEGFGDDLVSGKISPLSITWDLEKNKAHINSNNVNKTSMDYVTNKLIEEIAMNAKKIENYFGSEQDIEFSVRNGKLYFLQSRPITKYIF